MKKLLLVVLVLNAFAVSTHAEPSFSEYKLPDWASAPVFDPEASLDDQQAANEAYEKRQHLVERQHQNVTWDQLPKYSSLDRHFLLRYCKGYYGQGATLIKVEVEYIADISFLNDRGTCITREAENGKPTAGNVEQRPATTPDPAIPDPADQEADEAYEARWHPSMRQHFGATFEQLPKFYADDRLKVKQDCVKGLGSGTTLIDYRSVYQPDTGVLTDRGVCWSK